MANTVQYEDILYIADRAQNRLDSTIPDDTNKLLRFLAEKLIEVNMNLQILVRIKQND